MRVFKIDIDNAIEIGKTDYVRHSFLIKTDNIFDINSSYMSEVARKFIPGHMRRVVEVTELSDTDIVAAKVRGDRIYPCTRPAYESKKEWNGGAMPSYLLHIL